MKHQPNLRLLGGLLAAVLLATPARAQQGGETGWNARFAALDEERNAETGVAVSIVFDDSGSMNARNKLEMAKEAFRSWIARAPDSYRFGLVALNAGALVPLARGNKDKVLAAVDRLQAEGGTPLASMLGAVGNAVAKRRAGGGVLYERQVVVVLTDGEDTSARGNRGVQEEITRLRQGGTEVIAFGYQNEGQYMRDAATRYFSPQNGEDIRRGLESIGSESGDPSDVQVDDRTRTAMAAVAVPAVGVVGPVVGAVAPSPAARPTVTPKPFDPYAAMPTPTPQAGKQSSHGDSTPAAPKKRSNLWLYLFALWGIIIVGRRLLRK